MVTRMMRWPPWPPLTARKFHVRMVVRRIEGMGEEAAKGSEDGSSKVILEVRWKGPKATLGSLRRSVKRNRTREEQVREDGVVVWNEEFESVCTLTSYRENAFGPWEVAFAVFSGLDKGPKNKESVVGMASISLAEFVSTTEDETEIILPLLLPSATSDSHPSLHLSISLLEIRSSQESSDAMQKATLSSPLSLSAADHLPPEKDEISAIKAGLRKVKILTDFVSTRKSKKTCCDDDGSDEKCSGGSDEVEYAYPFDTDSQDGGDLDEGETEDNKGDNSVRKSFSYGTLVSANFFGGSIYSDMKMDAEYEDCIYYSHRRSDVGCPHAAETTSTVPEQFASRGLKRSFLPWKKRKLSFRSPKPKGEPLLKKAYGEEGGDDIDYDRRLLSSSDELTSGVFNGDDDSAGSRLSISEFGDDNFVIGSWESRDLVNRDGHLKLLIQVFFASIDQRSEQAAGESACTALVAVIADWFQKNQNMMPIKSQFDGLIREGSYEWRNLCENQTYRELFPDKHFDLDTVLQAKIRTLCCP